MKITLIGTLPPIKGVSPYCLELANALSKITDVEFIGFKKLYPDFMYPGGTKADDENYKKPEIKVIKNIITYYNPFSWIWAGLTAKGDVIHVQWWSHVLAPIYFVFLSIYKLRRKNIVITVHNVLPHENSKLNEFLNGIILAFGDAFMVHNAKNKASLSKIYNINEEKINIIPHGILETVQVRGFTREDARDYLKIPQNKKVILHFGNIRDYKGLDVLLESLKIIKDDINEILLIIAGKPWSDWEKYEKIIKENNLGDYVIRKLDFIPPSEVEYYFAASDVIVLPYKYFDSQSGVGALAIPFKKPLIVTDVGGLPDFVKDERAIVRPNDAKGLAKKLIVILKDKYLIDKLSNDSAQLANDYKWDKIADKNIKIYEGLQCHHY